MASAFTVHRRLSVSQKAQAAYDALRAEHGLTLSALVRAIIDGDITPDTIHDLIDSHGLTATVDPVTPQVTAAGRVFAPIIRSTAAGTLDWKQHLHKVPDAVQHLRALLGAPANFDPTTIERTARRQTTVRLTPEQATRCDDISAALSERCGRELTFSQAMEAILLGEPMPSRLGYQFHLTPGSIRETAWLKVLRMLENLERTVGGFQLPKDIRSDLRQLRYEIIATVTS